MSAVIAVGPSWPGISKIQYLMIFGASYCDIGSNLSFKDTPRPSKDCPLGVEFPGLTYAEVGKPNWIGHLITEFKPSPSVQPTVHCFAVGGATVHGVARQVQDNFLPTVGQKPDWAPWTSSDTLFLTWVGINDCARVKNDRTQYMNECMKTLMEQQTTLYDFGARNFLFINIPPIERSPAVPPESEKLPGSGDNYKLWNSTLHEAVQSFHSLHPDVTALIYSSYNTFSRVLDDPAQFGFKAGDEKKRGGSIWVDQLHPTSKMHREVAKDLSQFLLLVPEAKVE